MSCRYVCDSCARLLSRRARSFGGVGYRRNSSFVSLKNQGPLDDENNPENDQHAFQQRRRTPEAQDAPKRRPGSQLSLKEHSVEDDFLERLFSSRDYTQRDGLYSRTKVESNSAPENGAKNVGSVAEVHESPKENSQLTSLSTKRSKNVTEKSSPSGQFPHRVTPTHSFRDKVQDDTTADPAELPQPLHVESLVIEDLWQDFLQEIHLPKLLHSRYATQRKGAGRAVLSTKQNEQYLAILQLWCTGQGLSKNNNPSYALARFSGRINKRLLHDSIWLLLRQVFVGKKNDTGSIRANKELLSELLIHIDFFRKERSICHISKDQPKMFGQDWKVLNESIEMDSIRQWSNKDFSSRFWKFFPETFTSERQLDTAALATLAFMQEESQLYTSAQTVSFDITAYKIFISRLLAYSNISERLDHHRVVLLGHGIDSETAESLILQIEAIAETAIAEVTDVAGIPSGTTTLAQSGLRNLDDSNVQMDTVKASKYSRQAGSSSKDSLHASQALINMFQTRVGRATAKSNRTALEKLWKEAQATFSKPGPPNSASGVPAPVYTFFLTGFMTLRQPDRAIDIWNIMMANGTPKSISMWDAMIKGFGLSKDGQAVQSIWTRMIRSGIQPDAQVWSTRINALAESNMSSASIESFQEMLKEWFTAVHKRGLPSDNLATIGDIDNIPKPNILCLNSLITGLAKARKHEELAQVFKWARVLGLKLNAYSFNPLLDASLQDGNMRAVESILKQMQNHNVQPDIASFTMLISKTFQPEYCEAILSIITSSTQPQPHSQSQPQPQPPTNNNNPPTPTDLANEQALTTAFTTTSPTQQKALTALFAQMSTTGLQPNSYTFSSLITRLLHHSNSSTPAYAIINTMDRLSIPLSPQAYASLLTFHFSEQPPNVAAADALWQRGRSARHAEALDAVFWDRLVGGFARAGAVGKMMTALGQAGKLAKAPGWETLAAVITTLTHVGDTARAVEVVESVASKDDALKTRYKRNVGRWEFWKLAWELGLVENGPVADDVDGGAGSEGYEARYNRDGEHYSRDGEHHSRDGEHGKDEMDGQDSHRGEDGYVEQQQQQQQQQ